MNRVRIPARIYSPAIWDSIITSAQVEAPANIENVGTYYKRIYHAYEGNKLLIPPLREVRLLEGIVRFFQPNRVVEIGTGSGLTTAAIRCGAGLETKIFSCDKDSSETKWPAALALGENTKLFSGKMSTEMLKELTSDPDNRLMIDMFYFDGRLEQDDLGFIKQLAADECVFVFDDFEGVEKGVFNVLNLVLHGIGKIIVHPLTGCRTAMLLNVVQLVNQ